jgi:carbonic anhydrase/acetyltransferase-like protein (isoleucine patch superfamily)
MLNFTNHLLKSVSKGNEVFIADTARVIGDVQLQDQSSVWFGAVLRGDTETINIGKHSNIQDNAVIHADPGFPCVIGDACIIGHGAIVHGATLANNVLVGMHATIMNGVSIGEFSIIGSGAVVPEGMQIPPYSLVMGVPAKIIKPITEEQKVKIIKNAESYVQLAKLYIENQLFNSK